MKDYFGYFGKICVVTGAASGMGKAATEMLVDLGAIVYALDWAEVKINGIEKYIHTNLSKRASIDEAFTQIPEKIDSFFGIAGVSGANTDFNTTVIIDFVANKYICDEYLVHRMYEGGSIAFITSSCGLGWEKEENKKEYINMIETNGWDATVQALEAYNYNDREGKYGYALAKLSMNYYIAYLQHIFAVKGIRVNGVLPGGTDTGMTDEFAQNAGGKENLILFTGIAHRLASPHEMGQPVVFINSNMASYISGALLTIDYGMEIQMQAGLVPRFY